jgi:uncharacterized membrane protein YGL010W
MRQIEFLLNEYGESHKNKTNILIHAIAVPAIYFVTLALVWSIPTPTFLDYFDITWAHILVIPTLYSFVWTNRRGNDAIICIVFIWNCSAGVTKCFCFAVQSRFVCSDVDFAIYWTQY